MFTIFDDFEDDGSRRFFGGFNSIVLREDFFMRVSKDFIFIICPDGVSLGWFGGMEFWSGRESGFCYWGSEVRLFEYWGSVVVDIDFGFFGLF